MLVWANKRGFAWGYNYFGQLGRGTTTTTTPYGSVLPGAVTATGVLMNKTVLALAVGGYHSLALCSDGTLAAWGRNPYGQLGDNSLTDRLTPVAVNMASGVSALYGKRVVAIVAGEDHSLALCSDGTLAAWGANDYGQLGDNTTTDRRVPVAVNTVSNLSALYGKTVAAIAAGEAHSLALCSDGTVAAWGDNYYGQLGDNGVSGDRSLVPVAVNMIPNLSALTGKMVAAIAAGYRHNLALCSDGTVAAWGDNDYGQLGNNSTTNRFLVPVAVNTNSGVSALYGKTVTIIAAGGLHSLALCSNGTVATWGGNWYGQLGDYTTTQRIAPVAVNTNSGISALYGRTVTAIAAGYFHSVALCADRTAAAWGWNSFGQLGDNSTVQRNAPMAVNTTPLPTGQRFVGVAGSSSAYHTLALVAVPPISQIMLTGAMTLTNGSFRFSFTNTPGASFVVLAATNAALPPSNWTVLSGLAEVSAGQFQFTDSQATNSARRFYRVRSP